MTQSPSNAAPRRADGESIGSADDSTRLLADGVEAVVDSERRHAMHSSVAPERKIMEWHPPANAALASKEGISQNENHDRVHSDMMIIKIAGHAKTDTKDGTAVSSSRS